MSDDKETLQQRGPRYFEETFVRILGAGGDALVKSHDAEFVLMLEEETFKRSAERALKNGDAAAYLENSARAKGKRIAYQLLRSERDRYVENTLVPSLKRLLKPARNAGVDRNYFVEVVVPSHIEQIANSKGLSYWGPYSHESLAKAILADWPIQPSIEQPTPADAPPPAIAPAAGSGGSPAPVPTRAQGPQESPTYASAFLGEALGCAHFRSHSDFCSRGF